MCGPSTVTYTRLNANIFRGLSATSVVLWVINTGLVTAITIRYSNLGAGVRANSVGALDYVFAGLWSSLFYGIAGLIGLCASYDRQRAKLIPMAVLCFIGFCGAVTAAGISGHVAVYIMKNRDDVNNTICHPEEYYPPVFTQEDADEDCLAWAILEYVLMAYSIASAVVTGFLLIAIGVAVTGPKERNEPSPF